MNCPHINDQNVTFSVQGKLIYKDQCTKCFIEAKSERGLMVCLKCFNGACVENFNHAREHYQKTVHCLGMRIRVVEIPRPKHQEVSNDICVNEKGGIQIDFTLDQPDYLVETSVTCYQCNSEVQDERLNGLVQSIKMAESAWKKNQLAVWDCEIQACEHSLTMQQEPSFQLASEKLAKCKSCDLSNNLWLCLICGSLGCGRKNYDGIKQGGGNNHGMQHYQETGHALVVKLGTITSDGKASVHCYTCGDEVIDFELKNHLANFGIDIEQQVKTEKTIAELTLDANFALQLSKILEEGKLLKPLFGPGFTGLDNIGNSCYMNSIIQAFFHIPEIRDVYYNMSQQHHLSCQKAPVNCFTCQMCKVAYGIHSGDFSIQKEEVSLMLNFDSMQEEKQYYQEGIRLRDLKQMVAIGNNEFLSNRQQDALEYLEIFLKFIQKGEKQDGIPSTLKLFEFNQSHILQCTGCNGYKINNINTTEMKLPVELPTAEMIIQWEQEREINKQILISEGKRVAVDEQIPEYPTSFRKSLQLSQEGELVEIYCSRCKQQKQFTLKNYFKSFPQYLIVPVSRFYQENWVPKKLNAMIQVDQFIDLGELKEPVLDQKYLLQEQFVKQYDEKLVEDIQNMGFGLNAAKRALIQTKNNFEAAIQLIMDKMEDENFNAPLEDSQQGDKKGVSEADQEAMNSLISMGFSTEQAKFGLQKTDNNLERAIDYLFSHDVEQEIFQQQSVPDNSKSIQSKYELFATIIHLGKSTHCGHYVSYIKKDGKWILFNDAKVAESSDPVLEKGYIYIFKRI